MMMYFAMFRIRFINSLQYRAAALAGVVTQFAFGFMFISMYLAFYRTNPSAFPMEVSELVSYIWVQQAFIMLFVTWFFEGDIFAAITSDQIAYELARPMNLYSKWFCQCVASRMSRAVLRCLPILIIGFILPEPYRLTLPPDAIQFSLFILSSVLTLGVVVSFSMLIYITTFYTLSPLGIRIIGAMLADFMAGQIIPLPFFPDGFRKVAELLPFAAMQNMPLRIYSGNISGIDALYGILFQIFWIIILFVTGRVWMHSTLKKVVVQGG
jgi:ABC-2 type transport system permease protein